MKVSELIEKLQKKNPDMQVFINPSDDMICEVEVIDGQINPKLDDDFTLAVELRAGDEI